jgi:type II secretory pathway component PulK
MNAKVFLVIVLLVVWAVLVSASVQAASLESGEAQNQQPRANATRIVVGAMAAPGEHFFT